MQSIIEHHVRGTHYGIGVDPADGRFPTDSDLRDAHEWLLFAHDMATPA